MEPKKWYQSKILWSAVVTILLGAVPLILDLLQVIAPETLSVVTALLTCISGMAILVFRVLFTNRPLE